MDLAVMSGVQIATISLIETERRRQPKRETIRKLAEALDVPPEEIEIPIDEERRLEKLQRSIRSAQWLERSTNRFARKRTARDLH